jgi:redox-sensitive bicupin YhaK (pirin superfamily)
MSEWRKVQGTMKAVPASDGAGVKLNRTIGTPQLEALDPFLLLDEFNSENADDYIAGFPDHPHRGFETVTYMIEGRMRHEDNSGGGGLLRSGGVQWMTAGRGIVHSEMPEQEDGKMQGFQLWVNLPAKDKMCDPRYQEFDPEEVPEATHENGAVVRVVAGKHAGKNGAVNDIAVDPIYLDIRLPAGAGIEQSVPAGHNAFVYVFEGMAEVGTDGHDAAGTGTLLPEQSLAVLSDGGTVAVRAPKDESGRMLLVAGRPIGEPIARYGPFVMNTRDEIMKAFEDFQSGRF